LIIRKVTEMTKYNERVLFMLIITMLAVGLFHEMYMNKVIGDVNNKLTRIENKKCPVLREYTSLNISIKPTVYHYLISNSQFNYSMITISTDSMLRDRAIDIINNTFSNTFGPAISLVNKKPKS
jgi:hypothetical protein